MNSGQFISVFLMFVFFTDHKQCVLNSAAEKVPEMPQTAVPGMSTGGSLQP